VDLYGYAGYEKERFELPNAVVAGMYEILHTVEGTEG